MTNAVGATGLILAGGASRRMGREKSSLPWGAATLLEHVVETVRPAVDEVIVAVKHAGAMAQLHTRVVEDVVPDAHALGGLYTGLQLASHERCFVCACDAPFVNPRLIRWLIQEAEGWELVIPRTRAGLQPLHAVYAKSALPAIQEQLRQQRWDLRALMGTLRTRIVEPAQWRPIDRQGLSFLNLNTPADYVAARRIAAKLTRIMELASSSG